MTLTELGWTDYFQTAWNSADRLACFPARVIEQHKNLWQLASEHGELTAHLAGRLRHRATTVNLPVVGDWVAVSERTIYEVLSRRTQLARKAAGQRTEVQIIAANVDTAFVVSSLNREYNQRRIERYLTLIWESGAEPALILNKADLCDDPERMLFETQAAFPGIAVHLLSARTGAGLDELRVYLGTGRTVAFVGSSGVGKSTLINCVLGVERQAARAVMDDDRGRHTTTTRQLIALPSGGLLIDTPGMRELQLWGTDEGLRSTFKDIEALSVRCRFRNCLHESEPGCEVLHALDEGQLWADRYESYLKLRGELAYLERKQDVFQQLELKRKWKAMHKAHKKRYKTREWF
jgi:ribosome biogenesis GTPase